MFTVISTQVNRQNLLDRDFSCRVSNDGKVDGDVVFAMSNDVLQPLVVALYLQTRSNHVSSRHDRQRSSVGFVRSLCATRQTLRGTTGQFTATHRVGRQGGQLDTLFLKVFVFQGQSSNLGGTHRLQQLDLLSAEYYRRTTLLTGRSSNVLS